jgi:cation transport ATPase
VTDGAEPEQAEPTRLLAAAGPVVDPLPCSGCGKLIDPLRAGHVAIFDLRYHFFCDRYTCRAAFLGLEPDEEDDDEATLEALRALADGRRRPGGAVPDDEHRVTGPVVPALAAPPPAELPAAPENVDDPTLIEPIARTILTDESSRSEDEDPRDVGALLLVMAIVAGALAVALALAGDARLVLAARVVLALVGAGMLVGRAATTERDAVEAHPLATLAGAVGSVAVAAAAVLLRSGSAAAAASLAGVVVVTTAVAGALAEAARRPMAAERAWIAAALALAGRRAAPTGDGTVRAAVFDLRPGEQLVAEPGEYVAADVTVVGPDVEVLPWVGATTPVRRREGDPIVAGARVMRGKLRGVCTFSGFDRAFARVLLDPRRRADALVPMAQASRRLAERWAIAAAFVVAVSSTLARRSPIDAVLAALAVHAALANAVAATIASAHVARAILLGLRRGVVYRSADAWDRAGKVLVATFCARGTLLLGEPELAELEATGAKLGAVDVLALAAGVERAEEHPIATAIVRAARTRGVRPDGVRNPGAVPGLGVTAVSSSGEELLVGNRQLLLEQRISIASAEQRIAELEALGRTVVLVALGGRLVGLLGLQDGLRPGARAAVQHVLDARVEPVLMSGDSRETCEAIGRSLDIDHIRPEILPADRGAEVRRLIDAGTSVAVLGHAGVDDAALAAADVAVALGAAGGTAADFAVTLASDDVRDAALSIALAHKARADARLGIGLAVAPALLGAAALGFGILPPEFAPIAALLGGAMAVAHVRRT